MKNILKIGTHNGPFHADEVMACAMLKYYVPEYSSAEIIRTRDESILKNCDVVLDVGGIYDHSIRRYDHHQRGFSETFDAKFNKVKLSSAGLVYKHYGMQVISSILDHCNSGLDTSYDHLSELGICPQLKSSPEVSEEDVSYIYYYVYENFIQSLDAEDNGVDPFDWKLLHERYVKSTEKMIVPEALYKFQGDRLGVRSLNVSWNDVYYRDGKVVDESEIQDINFKYAMSKAIKSLEWQVYGLFSQFLPAKEIVQNAYNTRLNPEIMVLKKFCPWKKHLFDLEERDRLQNSDISESETSVKYTIFPSQNNNWMVQCVSIDRTSFKNRLDLKFKGMKGEQLIESSGVADAVFVHINGFIGAALSKEGAIKLAEKSLSGKDIDNITD